MGKSKNRGESFLETALREVREETGCAVVPREFIGSMAYDADGRKKVVHFWRMEAGEPLQAIDSEEVDLVRSLPLAAAVETLTYPREREFLQSTEKDGGAVKWQHSISWRHKLFDTSTARLQQELASFQVALRHPIPTAEVEQSWVTGAYALLDNARWAVQERNPELGWNCLKAAQRRGLFGLGPKELLVRARLLVSEATEEKLGKWRSDAVNQILLENGQLKSTVNADEVAKAAEILDTHYYNTYRRLRLRSFQFACLGMAALIFLTCYIAIVGLSEQSNDLSTWTGLSQVALLGALGAAVSGILRIGGDETARRITIELAAFGFLIARVVVGAAAALVLVAIWQSGFIKFPVPDQPKMFVIVLAFAAGFTERLAQNAIERLVASERKEDKQSPPKTSPRGKLRG
jgi:NUDIX domain